MTPIGIPGSGARLICGKCGNPYPATWKTCRKCARPKPRVSKEAKHSTPEELAAMLLPFEPGDHLTYAEAAKAWGLEWPKQRAEAMARVNRLVHYGWVRSHGPGLFEVVEVSER